MGIRISSHTYKNHAHVCFRGFCQYLACINPCQYICELKNISIKISMFVKQIYKYIVNKERHEINKRINTCVKKISDKNLTENSARHLYFSIKVKTFPISPNYY